MSGVILRRYAQFAVDRLIVSVPAFAVLLLGPHFAVRTPRGDGRLWLVYATLAVFLLALLGGNWFAVFAAVSVVMLVQSTSGLKVLLRRRAIRNRAAGRSR